MNKKYISWEEAVLWLKKQKNKEELVKACYFDDPLIKSAHRFYKSTEWQEVKRLLSPYKKGKALDIGAGRGISSCALARDGWKTVALEPNKSSLVGTGAIKKLIKSKTLPVTIVNEYAEQLPFKKNSFDLVYERQVLHHAKNLKKLCNEVYRVLKPNGIFLFTREHILTKQEDLQQFLDNHPLHNLYGGEHAYTLNEYRDAIQGSGLKIIKTLALYDSNINLFPSTKEKIKQGYVSKLGFIIPELLFKCILYKLNLQDNTPGRMYSFIGTKYE